jgi:hypothetical protein
LSSRNGGAATYDVVSLQFVRSALSEQLVVCEFWKTYIEIDTCISDDAISPQIHGVLRCDSILRSEKTYPSLRPRYTFLSVLQYLWKCVQSYGEIEKRTLLLNR